MIDEKLDIHPRVGTLLTQRNLLWIHEYRYPSFENQAGGSMDFLACDPKTGDFSIVECKIDCDSLSAIERQINRYFDAFMLPEARKEVYALQCTDKQRAWLSEREITVYICTMDVLPSPLATMWQTSEDIETVFNHWHGLYMLPRIKSEGINPFLEGAERYHRSEYIGGLARHYSGQLEKGDVSNYVGQTQPHANDYFYGDAE